jgi:hypothetical protein
LRQARKDFLHSLSLEYSSQITEYLKKVNDSIEKVKNESMQKLKRKVLFSSGIDFIPSDKSGDMHPDDVKK